MGQHYDAIVIGGGHNGLTNAAYLAKAGKKVCVLERRHVQFECAQMVVQLFQNSFLGYRQLEISLVGGDYSNISGNDAATSHSFKLTHLLAQRSAPRRDPDLFRCR